MNPGTKLVVSVVTVAVSVDNVVAVTVSVSVVSSVAVVALVAVTSNVWVAVTMTVYVLASAPGQPRCAVKSRHA